MAEATIVPAAMRIPQAASFIGVSPALIKKLIAQRRVRSVTLGRTRLILTASLQALLEGSGSC